MSRNVFTMSCTGAAFSQACCQTGSRPSVTGSIAGAGTRILLRAMILLTRKAEFSSAHFYWVDSWSEEENIRAFGKCANRNGHGHNYTLEVTVTGEVDPATGFVVDLKELKDVMEREVVSVYDHRHLNLEVPEFKTAMPTTENMAVAIWKRLDGRTGAGRLFRVRVWEQDDLFADYYGE